MGFSKKFCSKSPFKDRGTLAAHKAENPSHKHPADQYEPAAPDTSNEDAKADLEKNKSTRTPEQTAHLLKIINAARAEKGLSPVTTLEEGLKE